MTTDNDKKEQAKQERENARAQEKQRATAVSGVNAKDKSGAEGSGDLGAGQVQEYMDEVHDKGYEGTVADPTPNHNYTVAGNYEPTPETDPEMRKAVRDELERDR